MSGLMVLFVTVMVFVAVVYSIKFSGPSESTVIDQLKDETTKQNMKIGKMEHEKLQLMMKNNQLQIRKDDLEEQLQKCQANLVETEKEELSKKQIEDLKKELLKLKETQKGFVDTALNWLVSSFNSLKKQAEHTFYSIIWKKMYEFIQIHLL